VRHLTLRIVAFSFIFTSLGVCQSPLLWAAPTQITTDPAGDEYPSW
jgi:hypothetical protein